VLAKFEGDESVKTAYGKVVLLTGASSGIGQAIAEYLKDEGFHVYGTSRRAATGHTERILGPGAGFLELLQLDVCSDESVKQAVDYVLSKEGRLDILINNAGFGIAGAVEDTTPEEAFRQFDTNFFGVHRLCRQVLPAMRAQQKGLIINISSVAGLISIPFQSMYSASKYAVEGLTEALRLETKPLGINAVLVEPGDIKTGFTSQREFVKASETNPVYKERFTKSVNAMVQSEVNGPPPDIIVKAVAGIIGQKNPPIRVTPGLDYKTIVLLKRLLPSRLVAYVVAKLY